MQTTHRVVVTRRRMREETVRGWLTTGAATLWVFSVVYVQIVANGHVPLAWGFFAVLLVGAAATLTVIRMNKSTQRMLAQVYRAGRDAEEGAVDNGNARAFNAGMEAGRYMENDDTATTVEDGAHTHAALRWTKEDERERRDADG